MNSLLLLLAFTSVSGSVCGLVSGSVVAEKVPKPTAPPSHFLSTTDQIDTRFQGVLKIHVEYRAVIDLEKGDSIEVVFFPETAPNHVANIVSLARKGFYDSVTFHRVLPGFMAQTGDPTGTGSGGPGYVIKAEFSDLTHKRGTLSMARLPDPNSAGSQFFICLGAPSFLDGQYTVFGEVVAGMQYVDAIRLRDPGQNPSYLGDRIRTIRILERPVGNLK